MCVWCHSFVFIIITCQDLHFLCETKLVYFILLQPEIALSHSDPKFQIEPRQTLHSNFP